MFFDNLDKYLPSMKKYVFVDEGVPDKSSTIVYYDKQDSFRTQFLNCIEKVTEEYCIFISEDYILLDSPKKDLLEKYKDVLDKNKTISFIRFFKGMDFKEPKFKNYDNLYELCSIFPYFYSQSAAVWRTKDLKKIFYHSQESKIANEDYENSFEWKATEVCRNLDIRGLFHYSGEPKRGLYHHDCSIFPHIATALVKGKWNLSEYREELEPLLRKYKIDTNIRGVH
tara:strand:+ start:8987 stop:9664 length:678 start_codon:yes stop_codon:yes gene_type:complete